MNTLVYLIPAICIISVLPVTAHAAFGGKPPLGPDESFRYLFRPYDVCRVNCLGANYVENLLDMRVNIPSYTHLGYDVSARDAWHLQFPDDCGRFVEGLAFEDEFSPIVRLELIRRLMKGIISAHVPGTQGFHFFRHRSGGKTWMIFDDEQTSRAGRLALVKWGDSLEGESKVGFRIEKSGKWLEIDSFAHADDPEHAGDAGTARSVRYWNESPFVFKRHYKSPEAAVEFTGRYWLSDEDKPLEFGFSSKDADRLQIVVGEPGKPMQMFLDNGAAPGVIHLPDRKTTYSSDKAGSITLNKPAYNYLILRKQTAWASPGYSMAFLVIWDGRPETIEALAENGYGQIRVTYGPRTAAGLSGKVWLYPFQWLDDADMNYVYRCAEDFLANGRMHLNGFPSMLINNGIPAGLAAGAYVLAKYGDPFATTVAIRAENAVDAMLEPEEQGKKLLRAFFPAKAAVWMLRLGKLLGDDRLQRKYAPLVERTMARMMTPELGYDGKGWASGWDHFNCAKTLWLAHQVTGRKDYLEAFERAMTVYTIDEKGIYRHGERMKDPGGFETYFTALPMSLWGLGGKMDWCRMLLNLDVPSGWQAGALPVKDLWNDSGVGPWAQDDAVVDYVGACLGGANIPRENKYVLPVGAFPLFDSAGKVELDNRPIIENPYFAEGHDRTLVIPAGTRIDYGMHSISLAPGGKDETQRISAGGGRVSNGKRVCAGEESVTYSLDLKGCAGAALDLDMQGDGFRVEVSPDGKRWFERLDTWSSEPRRQSVDFSFLVGSRDELVRLLAISPPEEGSLLVDAGKSRVEREHCRYIPAESPVVYRLSLPGAVECRLEMILGNGCRIECSPDGRTWREKRDASLSGAKAVPDSGWLHFVDATDCLGKYGSLFIRLSGPTDASAFEGREAFIRRLTAYGVFRSSKAFVRISNTSPTGRFEIGDVTLRTWGR